MEEFRNADEDLLVEDLTDDQSTEAVHEALKNNQTAVSGTEPAYTEVVMVKRKTLW